MKRNYTVAPYYTTALFVLAPWILGILLYLWVGG